MDLIGEGAHIPPRSLYKYVTHERLDILQRLQIRFTQPAALNDPFEFSPLVDAIQRAEIAEAQFRERLQASEILAKVKEQLPPELASLAQVVLESNIPEYEQIRESLIKQGLAELRNITPHVIGKSLEILGSKIGILSLSEVRDQMPMWAHYAGQGTGFVIEFDTTHDWFHLKRSEHDDMRHLEVVRYVDSRGPKAMAELTGSDILYTKLSSWSYEREWRIARALDERTLQIDEIYLFDLAAEAISGITLGYNIGQKAATEIAAACRDIRLRHVRVEQARLDRRMSSLSFVPL